MLDMFIKLSRLMSETEKENHTVYLEDCSEWRTGTRWTRFLQKQQQSQVSRSIRRSRSAWGLRQEDPAISSPSTPAACSKKMWNCTSTHDGPQRQHYKHSQKEVIVNFDASWEKERASTIYILIVFLQDVFLFTYLKSKQLPDEFV